MQDGTCVGGLSAHERPEASPPDKSGVTRCACGRPADGHDHHLERASCRQCARTRPDGGDVEDGPRTRRGDTLLDGHADRPEYLADGGRDIEPEESPGTDHDSILLAGDCRNDDVMGDPRARSTGLPEIGEFDITRDRAGELNDITVEIRVPNEGGGEDRIAVSYRITDGHAKPRRVTKRHSTDGPRHVRRWLTSLVAANTAVARLDDVHSVETVDELLGEIRSREPQGGYEPAGHDIVTDGGRRLDDRVLHARNAERDEALVRATEQQAEALDRLTDVLERQADALEALAGVQMMQFEYGDNGRWTPESLYEDAELYGTGGNR